MTVYSAFRSPDIFLRIGLKTNPFCQLDPTELAAFTDHPPWVHELAERDWDVLVLQGESGLGKTSAAYMLMRALEPRFGAARYVRTEEHRPRLPKTPCGARLLVLDSVQRLPSRWRRKLPRWFRRTGAERHILVGQEDALGAVELRHGAVVHRIVPPAPNLRELQAWYRRRIERVLQPGHPFPELDSGLAQRLLEEAGGNRMRLQEALYQHFEDRVNGFNPPKR